MHGARSDGESAAGAGRILCLGEARDRDDVLGVSSPFRQYVSGASVGAVNELHLQI